MKNKDYCGTSQAAKILGVSVGTVQSMVEQEILIAWKTMGGHRRISLDSIKEFKQKNNQNSYEFLPLDVLGLGKSESKKIKEKNLDSDTLSILNLFLSLNARNRGLIFSIEKLSKKTGIQQDKVVSAINCLKDIGVITIYKTDICDVYFLNYFSELSNDWITPTKIVIENVDLKFVQ